MNTYSWGISKVFFLCSSYSLSTHQCYYDHHTKSKDCDYSLPKRKSIWIECLLQFIWGDQHQRPWMSEWEKDIYHLGTECLYLNLYLYLYLYLVHIYHLGTASWRPKSVGAMVGSIPPSFNNPKKESHQSNSRQLVEKQKLRNFWNFWLAKFSITSQWCIFHEWLLHPDWHTIRLWKRRKNIAFTVSH